MPRRHLAEPWKQKETWKELGCIASCVQRWLVWEPCYGASGCILPVWLRKSAGFGHHLRTANQTMCHRRRANPLSRMPAFILEVVNRFLLEEAFFNLRQTSVAAFGRPLSIYKVHDAVTILMRPIL